MPCCVIMNCSGPKIVSTQKQGHISYHSFPHDPIIKEKWIAATGRKDWFPTKHSTICSRHFENTSFIVGKKLRMLKKTAYPTIDILKFIDNDDENKDTPQQPLSRKRKLEKGSSPPDDAVPSGSRDVLAQACSASGIQSPSEVCVCLLTGDSESEQPTLANESAYETETLVIKTEVDDDQLSMDESDWQSTSISTAQTSSGPGAPSAFDFELLGPEPSDSPKTLKLMQMLKDKSVVIQKQSEQIQTLTQEVNRLLARNKHLEEVLKESGVNYV